MAQLGSSQDAELRSILLLVFGVYEMGQYHKDLQLGFLNFRRHFLALSSCCQPTICPCHFLSHHKDKRYDSVATRITNTQLSSDFSYRQDPLVWPTEGPTRSLSYE